MRSCAARWRLKDTLKDYKQPFSARIVYWTILFFWNGILRYVLIIALERKYESCGKTEIAVNIIFKIFSSRLIPFLSGLLLLLSARGPQCRLNNKHLNIFFQIQQQNDGKNRRPVSLFW